MAGDSRGRYETYEQTTNTFSLQGAQGAVQSVIDEDSFLPSLGVNWFISEEHQLRFAVSQTVARPDFKEAANATFTTTNLTSGSEVIRSSRSQTLSMPICAGSGIL